MAKHAAPYDPRTRGSGTPGYTGQHRAAPPPKRSPRAPYFSQSPSSSSPTPTTTAKPTTTTQPNTRPKTVYSGKKSGRLPLYTPRGPRTRYIRYIGNDEAANLNRLVAEWLVAVAMIVFGVPGQAANAGYHRAMKAVMFRLSALTAVFFVLALMSNGKGAKAASYFGLLIDLGIAFNAVTTGTFASMNNIFGGKSDLSSGVQLAADVAKADSPPIQSPPWSSVNSNTVATPSNPTTNA